MSADRTHTLTAVFKNGKPITTTINGHLAEGLCDQQFHAMKASGKYLYIAIVVDGDVRASHTEL